MTAARPYRVTYRATHDFDGELVTEIFTTMLGVDQLLDQLATSAADVFGPAAYDVLVEFRMDGVKRQIDVATDGPPLVEPLPGAPARLREAWFEVVAQGAVEV